MIRKIIEDFDIQLPSTDQNTLANAATAERQNTVENSNNNSMEKSKVSIIISQLISKHSTPNICRSGTIDTELISFKDVIIETDALAFWKNNQKKFPNLSAVAKEILKIPITNSLGEGAFSIAGCLIRDKRASIDPLRAERVLFVHDNYDLIQF